MKKRQRRENSQEMRWDESERKREKEKGRKKNDFDELG